MKWRDLDHRPTGITIVSILTLITAIIYIFIGILVLTTVPMSWWVGIIYLPLGLGYFYVGYGLLKGMGWAWTATVIAYCVGIPFSIGFTAIYLYYMYRPKVKSYFGKVKLQK
jgi:hypothetical protein